MESQKMEIGKTYQHNTAGGVVEVLDKLENGYKVKVPYCNVNASLPAEAMYDVFLLKFEYVENYHRVVVDCDGLVYQLED